MGDLSKHFDSREVACRCGCGYGQLHPGLVSRLERLRSEIGDKPLVIRSGIRCPPHNKAVGGSRRSRHQSCEAVDLDAGQVTERQARAAGFTGIGLKGRWAVHVDIRQVRTPTIWHY